MDALHRQVHDLRGRGAAQELSALGRELRQAGRLAEAAEAFRAARELGDTTALSNLATTLDMLQRTDEAEAVYRDAIAAGQDECLVQLADMLLHDQPRRAEVEALLRLAVDREALSAWYVLGKLLARQPGRRREAEQALRSERDPQIAPFAQYELACLLLEEPGREQDAATALRASGIPEADAQLGRLLLDLPGRGDEAVAALRRAAEGGVDHGWNNLTVALVRLGRPGDADAAYRDGIAAGELGLLVHYGEFLRVNGRTAEAEQVLRAGLQVDARCAFVLGVLLVDQPGRAEEGRRLLRAAAGAGVAEAASHIARAVR